MSRKSPGRRRATRSNPKPRAWSTKGPSRAYPCKSPLLGRTVRLGRSEVVVESCATPSRARPGQGQFRVRAKATGKSRAVARRRVSAAIYRAKHPRKMPPGLLTFWAKTRGGGVPASALRRAPEKEIPAFVYDPHGPLPSAQFGPGAADALRPDFRHRALPSAQFGPTAPEPGRRPPEATRRMPRKLRARFVLVWRQSPLPKKPPPSLDVLNDRRKNATRFHEEVFERWVSERELLAWADDPSLLAAEASAQLGRWVADLQAKNDGKPVHVVTLGLSLSGPVFENQASLPAEEKLRLRSPGRTVLVYIPAYYPNPKISAGVLHNIGVEVHEAMGEARPNPSRARWRQNHHGGWHAPGDPLGYAPRANRRRSR